MSPQNSDRASFFPAIEKKHGMPMAYWFEQMAEIKHQKYPEQMAYLRENHGFSQAHANALIQYCRGNLSSRRFNNLDEYLAGHEEAKQAKVREIFEAITSKFKNAEVVIAWNQPMVKVGETYVFGVSVLKNHLLMAPWSTDVLQAFLPRLTEYKVNKKTIEIPVDWKVDKKLLRDMVAARLAEIE